MWMWRGYLTGIGSVVLMSLPSENLLLTHGHLCKQFSHLAAKCWARFLLWLLSSRFPSSVLPNIQASVQMEAYFSLPRPSLRIQISAPMTRTLLLVNRFPGIAYLLPCLLRYPLTSYCTLHTCWDIYCIVNWSVTLLHLFINPFV